MRGEVISVDAATGGGLISGEDGARYAFSASSARGPVRVGDRVDFLGLDGNANDVMVLAAGAGASTSFATAPGTNAGGGAYDFAWSMFSFNGRLRRQHFWINWAILFFGGFILGLIPFLGAIISLAAIWPQIAIQVKRLHDMGQSGWLVLAPIGVNIVLMIIGFMSIGMAAMGNAEALEREDPAAVMAMLGPVMGLVLVFIVVNLGWLLWIGITDSKPGRNQYGPNPKYPDHDDSVFA